MPEKSRCALRFLLLAALLYGFFVGLGMMGLAFKLFGKGFAEELIARTTNPFVGLFIGILATTQVQSSTVITIMVQSSSITTSVIVPLLGAGVITLPQAFPLTVGANIGTTVTAMLAALSLGSPAGVMVAFHHILFNVTGAISGRGPKQ